MELKVVYSGTKRDINTDWAIETNVENYLEKDPSLIEVVLTFFEKCDIWELRLRLAPVILDVSEYKPAFYISVESGRSRQWLHDTYESVREMVRKGIIVI